MKEGERRPEILYPDQKKKSRRSKASRVGSPSPLEILKERQKAMEVAASLSGSDHGSTKQSQEDLEHSESEQESEFSHSSDKHGPDVTPGPKVLVQPRWVIERLLYTVLETLHETHALSRLEMKKPLSRLNVHVPRHERNRKRTTSSTKTWRTLLRPRSRSTPADGRDCKFL
ncbi:hypothetical protein NDU88_001895 [Pleurodeles waltl]|uniref:Uncharacterized protein n=1 Tax=Pleurodeles waltl TaxID=8319 RepID=A0AAV7QBE7_PLEWA|nr:hypothetical protein NDU88_001895 [Pleurodeles waltl]